MTNLIIEKLLAKSRRTDIPTFAPGDTIRVQVKIKEGDKERLQAFEGVVIKRTRGQQASLHRPQDELRAWRRAYLPDEFQSHRQDRRAALRQKCAAPSSITCAPCAARPPV